RSGDGIGARRVEWRRGRGGGGWNRLREGGVAGITVTVTPAVALAAVADEAKAENEAHHQQHNHHKEADLGRLPHVAPHLPLFLVRRRVTSSELREGALRKRGNALLWVEEEDAGNLGPTAEVREGDGLGCGPDSCKTSGTESYHDSRGDKIE
ncbi:hypothetical protein GW17_00039770, partial [Ensete ventricosum]